MNKLMKDGKEEKMNEWMNKSMIKLINKFEWPNNYERIPESINFQRTSQHELIGYQSIYLNIKQISNSWLIEKKYGMCVLYNIVTT